MNRFAAAVAALAALAACAPDRFRRENPEDFAAHAGEAGAFVLDVRTPEEYAGGRLAGAKLVPVHELEARLSELPPDKKTPIHVYCARGGRSAKAARLLTEKGYEAVHDLAGGIAAWTGAGKSVVRGTP
jgi:phage shock protein E